MAFSTAAKTEKVRVDFQYDNHPDTTQQGAVGKPDMRTTIDAVHTEIITHMSAINNSIPEPAKTELTNKQKARMMVFIWTQIWRDTLVFDTTRVSDPGHFGFEYTDDSGNPPAIQSVRIVDEDTVRISLSSVPLATARKSVRYAYTGTAGQGGGPQTGARGNLRDSDPTPSMHGNRLCNWAVHFDEPVK